MSLFKLCYTGLLSNETSIILEAFSKHKDWKKVQELLFESGFVSSKNRANEIKNEIRRRFSRDPTKLPIIDDIIAYHSQYLSETEKKELFYLYLYYSDHHFMQMVDLLRDIDNSSEMNATISRSTLKKMFIDYQKSLERNPKEKTIQNWIGRFISILRDVKILVRKKNNEYILNFGFISKKNWLFLSLYSYFNKLNLLESAFLLPFNLNAKRISMLIEKVHNPLIKYKVYREQDEIISIELITKCNNLEEWILNRNE